LPFSGLSDARKSVCITPPAFNPQLDHRNIQPEAISVRRYFLSELAVVGAAAGLLTAATPHHPTAVIAAVVVSWVGLQAVSAWHFMSALYRGDVIESGARPHLYAPAPRAKLNWYARRFMLCYLNVPKDFAWLGTAAKPAISGGRDMGS
jgi:hypothetical protein